MAAKAQPASAPGSTTGASVGSRQRLLFVLSAGGYAFALMILFVAMRSPVFDWTGDAGRLFDPVGDAFRDGRPIYGPDPGTLPFFYAPPWALAFGLLSWLPIEVLYALTIVVNVAALRYMAGSWLAAGWLAWIPLVPITLNTGNLNLLLAGAIFAGATGATALPAVMGLAKISPFITIHPRNWRPALLIGLALFAITLPWLHLWPEWVTQVVTYAGSGIGPQIPIPFVVRAPVALALLLLRKPWAIALAAVVAIPAFYWESFVVFIAPLCVWLRADGDRRRARADAGADVLAPAPVSA